MGIERSVRFSLRDLIFEYDEEKNRKNIEKHGISFKTAARVFFDYDHIEMYDEEHSAEEDRYNTIGDASAAESTIIGNLCVEGSHRNDILFVVYTERELAAQNGFIMANKTDGGSTLAQDLSFTPDERAELDRAKAMPITFDEDCPETTPERALRFRRVNSVRTVGTGG